MPSDTEQEYCETDLAAELARQMAHSDELVERRDVFAAGVIAERMAAVALLRQEANHLAACSRESHDKLNACCLATAVESLRLMAARIEGRP